MKDGLIRVVCVSPDLRVADCHYNTAQMIHALQSTADAGAKLIVFPELSITGYTCGDLFGQQCLLEVAEEGLEALLHASTGFDTLVVVGLPARSDQKLYNCAAVLQNGALLGVIPKKNLPNYGEFYEARNFTPAFCENRTITLCGQIAPFGTKLLFCCRELTDFVLGVELCEDLWVPAPPSIDHAIAGATVLANLSASDEVVGKPAFRRSMIENQSSRLLCAYLYADAGRGESTTDMVFSGNSLIAENGAILAEAPPFSGEVVQTEIDVARLSHERRRRGTFPSAGQNSYERVFFSLTIVQTPLTRPVSPHPFIPADQKQREARCEEILSIQAQGLRKRMAHTNAKTVVLGLSGGLDSTLALLVCVRAMALLDRSASDILALTMPCFGTTSRTRGNAERLAKCLRVTLRTIDITASVGQHFEELGHNAEDYNVVFENAQARERTQLLMDVANQANGIVVGTGDLSELALGWATYNGDHMSMYGVNASVPKTLIRHLVSFEADRATDPELAGVLRDVLDTPVSPELLPPKDGEIAQKTEGLVGPYDLHDFFLYYTVRWGFPPDKILRLAVRAFTGTFDRKTILHWMKIFYQRFFSQQFKRSCLPDGPKVGSVSLSPRGDWRMPSDASAKLWLAQLEALT